MKKIISIGLLVLVVWGFARLNKYCSDKVYESCIESGKNSQETCYDAAYNN